MKGEIKKERIEARVSKILKEKFIEKLEKDGLTQTDFLVSCVMNYLEIKTIPKQKNKK